MVFIPFINTVCMEEGSSKIDFPKIVRVSLFVSVFSDFKSDTTLVFFTLKGYLRTLCYLHRTFFIV
jgi:hypothetical protein